MKKLTTTLTALVMATGLTMTAQAATKVTTTAKTTTTQKTMPAKSVKASNTKMEKSTKTSVKKANRSTTKTGKKTGEVNIDIPAELKIDESNNKTVAPSTTSGSAQTNNMPMVVPVAQVTQTGPAVQSTSVQPIDNNTAITSTTTTIPVDVQTVPAVVQP